MDYFFQIAMLILGVGIFPFAAYFFKRNERLHEETQKSQAEQNITLAVHDTRIQSLESWRLAQSSHQD